MTRLRTSEKRERTVYNRLAQELPQKKRLTSSVSQFSSSDLQLSQQLTEISETDSITSLGERAVRLLTTKGNSVAVFFRYASQATRFALDVDGRTLKITSINEPPVLSRSGEHLFTSLTESQQWYFDGMLQLIANGGGRLFVSEPAAEFSTILAFTGEFDEQYRERLALLLRAVQSRGLALKLLEEARAETTTDDLTGLTNRRYFVRRLAEEIDRAGRHSRQLALIILDLDHLKQLNDSLGHQTGDEALREIAIRLKQSVRRIDMVCRYAGDEFCIIMPDAGIETCQALLRRLHHSLNLSPSAPDCPTGTISMGGAVFPLHAKAPDQLLRIADSALRQAKKIRATFVLANQTSLPNQ